MDPELREYLDRICDNFLKSHEEVRSDLKTLNIRLQGQTRKLDQLSDPKSGVKELEVIEDNIDVDLTPVEETNDIVPDLADWVASAKPIEIDATSIAAPTPTRCSTDGCSYNVGGYDPMAGCHVGWSTPPSFTVPPGDSPTPSSEPTLGLTFGALAHTKYSTKGSKVSFNSIVLVSMSGAARSAMVTTLSTAASQGVVPTLTLTTPNTNYNGLGQELRPLPWPSFDCSHQSMHLKHLGLLRQSTYVMAHFVDYLNSMRNSWRYLLSVILKQCPSEKVDYWILMVPKDTCVTSQQIVGLMDVRLKLQWLSISCKCRTVHALSELLHVQWKILSREALQGSGRCAKQCSSEQYGRLLDQLICCFEYMPIEEPFGCLQRTQWQSWRPPDRATSDVKRLSQKCYSQTVVEEFYLRNLAWVRKLENNGSNNSMTSVVLLCLSFQSEGTSEAFRLLLRNSLSV